jgi:Uma2 family endonuclease
MASGAGPVVTEEEYLALAEKSNVKLEFVGGVVRPVGGFEDRATSMAGGGENHGSLQFVLPRIIGPIIDSKGCHGYASDTRVKVKESGEYVYPDLSVACPKGRFDGTSLLNPTLIVEVLSPGTADHDRGAKWELYQSIPSLEEYLMVHSESARVERYRRHGDVWVYESVRGLEASIEVLGGMIRLTDLYRDVEFENL